eukprot:2489806-Amphidinium_carterae.2
MDHKAETNMTETCICHNCRLVCSWFVQVNESRRSPTFQRSCLALDKHGYRHLQSHFKSTTHFCAFEWKGQV